MFGLGFSEILVLAILALILLGPDQLPDIARKLGRFVNDLKRTTDGLKDEFRNTGLDPSRLLDEIKREDPLNPGQQTPESLKPNHQGADNTQAQNQVSGQATSHQETATSVGHVEGAHDEPKSAAAMNNGKDDSGKK